MSKKSMAILCIILCCIGLFCAFQSLVKGDIHATVIGVLCLIVGGVLGGIIIGQNEYEIRELEKKKK